MTKKRIEPTVTVTEMVPARLKRDEEKSRNVQLHIDGLDNAISETIGALYREGRMEDAKALDLAWDLGVEALGERFELSEEANDE